MRTLTGPERWSYLPRVTRSVASIHRASSSSTARPAKGSACLMCSKLEADYKWDQEIWRLHYFFYDDFLQTFLFPLFFFYRTTLWTWNFWVPFNPAKETVVYRALVVGLVCSSAGDKGFPVCREFNKNSKPSKSSPVKSKVWYCACNSKQCQW